MKSHLAIFNNNDFAVNYHILAQLSKFRYFRKSVFEFFIVSALKSKIVIHISDCPETGPSNLKNPIDAGKRLRYRFSKHWLIKNSWFI